MKNIWGFLLVTDKPTKRISALLQLTLENDEIEGNRTIFVDSASPTHAANYLTLTTTEAWST